MEEEIRKIYCMKFSLIETSDEAFMTRAGYILEMGGRYGSSNAMTESLKILVWMRYVIDGYQPAKAVIPWIKGVIEHMENETIATSNIFSNQFRNVGDLQQAAGKEFTLIKGENYENRGIMVIAAVFKKTE